MSGDSASIRSQLGYPIIDTDGHIVEFMPVFEDYVAEYAGSKGVAHYRRGRAWFELDDAGRQARHLPKPPWGYPVETTEHMSSMLPALLAERLGEIGIDYIVMHPSPKRIGVPHLHDDELRQPLCRALNAYMADLLRPHADCMTPAAVIPMHTPTEAIEELEFAVGTLGMKASMLPGSVTRDGQNGPWTDNLVIESEYDYDPVWAKFQELGVVPAFHSGTIGTASRISSTNSLYNFIGHFAEAQASACKSIVLGGVTRRFPELKFAFETSGVVWAALLLSDLNDLWGARNLDRVMANDPARFDLARARELFGKYAPPRLLAKADQFPSVLDRMSWLTDADLATQADEYALAGITDPADLDELFVRNLYFACEGTDRFNFLAFADSVLPRQSKLKAIFTTDLGHFTSTPQTDLVREAHRAIETGAISPEDFKNLMFGNAVELFTHSNPQFFAGTSIEPRSAPLRFHLT